MQRVEFTIEPFVEAHPGDHVTAPIAALAAIGIAAEIGPFGSCCDVPAEQVGDVVATVVRTAIEHGATHINVDVTSLPERDPS